MSRLLAGRQYFREKLGLSPLPSDESSGKTATEETSSEKEMKEMKEAEKNEYSMIVILKNARKKYKERGLVGSLDISGSLGIFTTSLSCNIGPDDPIDSSIIESEEIMENEKEVENLRAREKIVLSYLDHVLKTLERRAKVYHKMPFSDDLALSNGVYISDPIFGSFTFSISLTASVASIMAEIETKQAGK